MYQVHSKIGKKSKKSIFQKKKNIEGFRVRPSIYDVVTLSLNFRRHSLDPPLVQAKCCVLSAVEIKQGYDLATTNSGIRLKGREVPDSTGKKVIPTSAIAARFS